MALSLMNRFVKLILLNSDQRYKIYFVQEHPIVRCIYIQHHLKGDIKLLSIALSYSITIAVPILSPKMHW